MMRLKVDQTTFRALGDTAFLLGLFLILLTSITLPADAEVQYKGGREYRGQLYGQFCTESGRGGPYGARTPVATIGEATQAIEKCLSSRNHGLHARRILDNRGYYQIEIVEKNWELVDRLIVMKRNGRVRSVYESLWDTQHTRGDLNAKE